MKVPKKKSSYLQISDRALKRVFRDSSLFIKEFPRFSIDRRLKQPIIEALFQFL